MQLNQTEISFIEKICSDLYTEFGDLNRGGCAVFAKAMNEKFKTNTFLYVFEKNALEQDPPIHIYIKLKRGKYLDVLGFKTKKEVFLYYGWGSIVIEDNIEILEINYQDLGEGLSVTDYKDHYLDIKKFIFTKYARLKNDTTILIEQ